MLGDNARSIAYASSDTLAVVLPKIRTKRVLALILATSVVSIPGTINVIFVHFRTLAFRLYVVLILSLSLRMLI